MSNSNFFEGQKIRLRAFEPGDAPALLSYLNHPVLTGRRYLPGGFPSEFPLSLKQVEGVLHKWDEEQKSVHLAVELLGGGVLAGHTELEWDWDPHCPFLSVVIAPDFQRQGLGSEAASLLLNYVFTSTPAHNVSSWMSDWNEPARAFAHRLGFQECGRFRRDGIWNGRYSDGVMVDLLRLEWAAQPRHSAEQAA